MEKPQLTIEDVAHYLRRDAAVVQRWLEEGVLPGYALPDNYWLIMRDDLDGFLVARRHQNKEHGKVTPLGTGS